MAEGTGKSETAKREEEILAFWRENKTFERSLEKDAPNGEFVFYDGPPFATGLPHHGSLLSSIIKDVIPRYKTMRGFRVRRRWGWDTHGLPIESLVEKELGLKTKKEILEIGIEKFNAAARSMVLKYVEDWKQYVERVGRWVDYDNSYKTMDNTFIESVWWGLKQLWDKELLYEGRKVLMYCPHCETPLAKAEIAMDNTYKDVTEEAVTVKFKVKNPSADGLPENTYLLAWTTTPWTLPGNVALAVGSEINYTVTQKDGEHFVTAESLAPKGEMVANMSGERLVGIEYEPLFDIPQMQSEKSHKVYAADFVTTGDGTGIVHTAVMYGEDDFVLGQKEGLPTVQMLEANGNYNDIVPEFLRGKYIKAAERDIKKDLESRGLMFRRENHTHSYPHCWRCGTPLIYNAVPSWFINIQKVKAKMLSENEKVNWVPGHLKHGRFGNIVENAPDWTISRNRFWASPLPIWKSKEGKVMVIGGLDELKRRARKNGNAFFVMRHGESENNAASTHTFDLHLNGKLTEKGRAEVAAAAESLTSIDLIIASPYARTKESAEIVAGKLGLSKEGIVYDDRLREWEVSSEFDGKPRSEMVAYYNKGYHESPRKHFKDGESFADMVVRAGGFLYDIERTHVGKRILFVTHSGLIRALTFVAEGRVLDGLKEKPLTPPGTGSVSELAFAPLPHNSAYELDLHRPYTDSIVLIGDDGAEYTRIPEVVDCWVESGSMPFAEYHYPFENKEEFEKRAPGDFIAEYIAQTRTWFYYMHAMGVLLFDRLAFRNVVSTGNLLAADGSKISKSKRNYTDPLDLIDEYGSDAVRLYLMGSPVMQAEDVRFRDEDVRDAHNKIIGMLWNTFKFFDLYQKEYDGTEARKSAHVLDKWILARLDETAHSMSAAMDAYDTPNTVRALRSFVDDYSTWYVRRSRERMKSEWHDKQHSLATQREVLLTVAKLIAPIAPFIAESIWRGIEGGGSVHLQSWPEKVAFKGLFSRLFGGEKKDPVLAEMTTVRSVVSKALEARDRAGIKVRQPLAKLTIKNAGLSDDLLEVIRDEVNVKGVEQAAVENDIELDTNITPVLKEEGAVREAIRAVQDARKKAGLKLGEHGAVSITVSDRDIVEKNLAAISEQTNTDITLA